MRHNTDVCNSKAPSSPGDLGGRTRRGGRRKHSHRYAARSCNTPQPPSSPHIVPGTCSRYNPEDLGRGGCGDPKIKQIKVRCSSRSAQLGSKRRSKTQSDRTPPRAVRVAASPRHTLLSPPSSSPSPLSEFSWPLVPPRTAAPRETKEVVHAACVAPGCESDLRYEACPAIRFVCQTASR